MRVIVGLQSIRVIADQRALETFRQTLYPGENMSFSTDLTEISLLMPPEATQTKGIIAKITAELALNDVNLVGIMCCAPEAIVLVTEKDAPRALETMQRMFKEGSVPAKRNDNPSAAALGEETATQARRPSLQAVTS